MADKGRGGNRGRTAFYLTLIGDLTRYAENEFALSKTVDEATVREHLLSVYRQTGVLPEQLQPVDCPDEIGYLWEYFLSMHKRRTSNGYGANTIASAEMHSWAWLRGVTLLPFELDALDSVEAAYMCSLSKPQGEAE